MKSMIIKYSGLICFLLITLLLSCKKESDEFSDDINFTFYVVDDLNDTIYGAAVCFYDNEQTYLNARTTGIYAGYVDSMTSIATGNNILLSPEKEYYVLINYLDPIRNITLTNIGVSSRIENLEKGSQVTAKISILPVDGYVSFWSPLDNKFPLKIKINGIWHPLTTSRATDPVSLADTVNTRTLPLLPGTYPYIAESDNGCVWTGSVTINRNSLVPVKLSLCERGRISFTSGPINAHGEITVVLDNIDTIGVITTGSGFYSCSGGGSGLSESFGSGDYITATRSFNTYNYVAKTDDGACIKTGTITINSDTCISIFIPSCP